MALRTLTPVSNPATLVLAVHILAGGVVAKNIPTYAGPYLMYADRMYTCEGNISTNEWDLPLRVSHFNPARPYDKQTLTGYVNATSVYDDRWWINFEASKRSNNQWKPNAFLAKFPTKACTAFRTQAPGIFRALYHDAGEDVMTGRAPCVLPKRVYPVNREPVDWVLPNVPILPYGEYRMSVMFGVGPMATVKPTICASLNVHIIPRP